MSRPRISTAVRAAIRPETKLLFVETVGNPSGIVADLRAFAEVAHEAGIPLVVDNTFATPYLCRPIDFGADVVLHSATKFINGHGTAIGGVLIESGKFPWDGGRFPLLSTPSLGYHGKVFTETFGEYAFLMRARAEVSRDVGAAMSPMEAWLMLIGLETLELRMQRHVGNARAVAAFLRDRPEVAWIREPEIGSIFTFGLKGGREAGRRFIDALELWSHLANVGDAKSLVIHPASTTHSQLSDEELRKAGVEPESIRLSVGLEEVDDLLWDLGNGSARLAMILTTPSRRRELLAAISTIAMVGASSNPLRPSYTVFSYLADADSLRRNADQSDALRDRRRRCLSVAESLRAGARRSRSRQRLSAAERTRRDRARGYRHWGSGDLVPIRRRQR